MPTRTADIVLCQDFFPQIGGAHHWLYEVYRRWPTPVTMLAQDYGNDPIRTSAQLAFDLSDHQSLNIVRAPMRIQNISLANPQCLLTLSAIVRRLSALRGGDSSRLHCLRAFPEGIAATLAKIVRPTRTTLIVYAHGEEILIARSSRQLHWIASTVYRSADLVIANCANTADLVRSLSPRARIACIHPGVDVDRFQRGKGSRDEVRMQLGWPTDTVIVCTVSRMEPRKNHAAVIRAIAALRHEGLPVAYICGGDGEERTTLALLTRALGLESWVRFVGAVSDDEKVRLYAAADVHAMPSIQVGHVIEGFGIVFMEAAATGLPSVSGNTGGQAEAVIDGHTGLVVDGRDEQQVKLALERLVRNPELRTTMGHEAEQRALRYDWGLVTAATISSVDMLRST